MASRGQGLQEECGGWQRRSSGTFQGATTRAAAAPRAAGELAVWVLATPGPLQLTILGHLEHDDKMGLGSTCTTLRQASLVWFPEVTLVADVPGQIDAASLAVWLQRHQACLHLENDLEACDIPEVSEAEWNDKLTALPPPLFTSLDLHTAFGLPAAVHLS
ncbi:hypothetical protein D9Q98_007767 [Chlorella vulgaris]|uniref:Uncharacterized protein n=1 Tax=Chlorella vulgaris TaxID=3077 RepID=A0A9D4YTZ4_CHLVU|nr:hypothetical protein D9Q98_007767 [Chlorella vulgaris]